MDKPEKKKPKTQFEGDRDGINVEKVEGDERIHYYVANFLIVLDDVFERYSALFSPEEVSIIKKWKDLSYSAKQLYVRLFSRKPIWFLVDGLDKRYKEIQDLSKKCIPELIHSKFMISSSYLITQSIPHSKENQQQLSSLLYSVLKQSNLVKIISQAQLAQSKSSALTKRKRKPEKLSKMQMATLIASNYFLGSRKPTRAASFSPASNLNATPLRQRTLSSFFSPQTKSKVSVTPLVSPIPFGSSQESSKSPFLLPSLVQNSIPGDCIALSSDSRNLFKIIQHLFFLSPWQDQSLLVLTGMEKIKFPKLVETHASCNRGAYTGIFDTRQQFEDYQRALFLEMELNYALNKLRPSTQSSAKYGNPFSSSTEQWKMSLEEVSSLDIFDDSFLVRYNYNWQCHSDPSAQHTLIRVLHHCCLHLYTSSFEDELDPYRNIQPQPPPLSVQLQAIISIHNSINDRVTDQLIQSSQADLTPKKTYNSKENQQNMTTTPIKAKREKLDSTEPVRNRFVNVKEEPIEETKFEESEKIVESPGNKASWMDRFRAEWIMARIITHGVAELEKQKDYNAVSCMYRLLLGCKKWSVTRRGQWWERLSLVLLSHLSNPAYSLSVALLSLNDSQMPDLCPERISLMKRMQRLYKPPLRWSAPPDFPPVLEASKIYITGNLLLSAVGKKNRWKSLEQPKELQIEIQSIGLLSDDKENQEMPGEDIVVTNAPISVGVEKLALQYYQQHGWEGLHCEGGIVYPLFTMLLYPVLFSDVPSVFQSKFQDAPLDLYSYDFYTNRMELFEAALSIISSSSSEEISQSLEEFWEIHRGEIIKAVDWNRYPLILYQTICTCFGGERLAELFRIVAQNYRASRSGMPDLLLWKIHIDENGLVDRDILFSEVKGPRDRLSAKQILWIHRMLQSGIPVEVLHVKEAK